MNNNLKISAFIIFSFLCSCSGSKTIDVGFNENSSILNYGLQKLQKHVEAYSYALNKQSLTISAAEISIINSEAKLNERQQQLLSTHLSELEVEGYKILKERKQIFIVSKSEKGALYGLMDIIEQLGASADLSKINERHVNPAFSFRAIKFNLPWSPYRPGPATDLHYETCKDLKFWEAYLNMMVENKFNALSLWNTHPFPYLIRAKNYPNATPFNDQELGEWKTFWKALFKMAKDRGIETYLVNWNIVVSPSFAEAYGAKEHEDRSELVKKYTRESVTQVINEYEDLTGLGVTLADWMGNWGADKMSGAEREDWIEDTFVKGMAEANRKIKFIHRAVLAGDPKEMRRVIDHADLPDKTIVEVKFNWSHGHSTPNLSLTHSNDAGTIMRDFWEPQPENYFIAWMIRNEDFFVLRWGDPEFIRAHIKTNHHDYVDGYFVGSEGYIPALDYSHKSPHPHKTWNYAFEKQWLFYHLWGRLTYNPQETNEQLTKAFNKRYKSLEDKSSLLLSAYTLASKVPEHIASFYKGTWDFTLYSEGFMSAWPIGFDDERSPFISIEELVKHETLDARFLSIAKYAELEKDGLVQVEGTINPLELAQELQIYCASAMSNIQDLRTPNNEPALDSELDDLETWCHLGYYFADKLRAGVSLEVFKRSHDINEKEKSRRFLKRCLVHWKNVIRLTKDRYQPMPYVSMGYHEQRWPAFKAFHWSNFLDEVEADIEYVGKNR